MRRSVFQSIVPTWFTIAFRIGLILLDVIVAAAILVAPTENALQEGIVGGVPGKALPPQNLLSHAVQGGSGVGIGALTDISQGYRTLQIEVRPCRCLLPNTISRQLEGDFGESFHGKLHGRDPKIVGDHIHY